MIIPISNGRGSVIPIIIPTPTQSSHTTLQEEGLNTEVDGSPFTPILAWCLVLIVIILFSLVIKWSIELIKYMINDENTK